MSWPAAEVRLATALAESTLTAWVSSAEKELFRVFVERTDSPLVQTCFIRIFGSTDGVKQPEDWNEEWVIAVGKAKREFPIVGYRFWALEVATPLGGDDAVVDVDYVGDGGL